MRGAELLRTEHLVAFPTETVYGLGAHALSASAVTKIFLAKGRPATNPLIVHIPDVSWINRACGALSSQQLAWIELLNRTFWPGPLSLVLPAHNTVPKETTAGRASIAIRIPNHPVALALINAAGVPIAAPSANLSTYVSPTTAHHVLEGLGERVALIIDDGPCSVGVESTVLSLLNDTPVILRAGGITHEELARVLGTVAIHDTTQKSEAPNEGALSPGLSALHYAPKTPVFISEHAPHFAEHARIGRIFFSKRSQASDKSDYAAIETLSQTGNLAEIARNLYAALRALDGIGLDAIVIDSCEERGLGAAIMDRVRRACAQR
jgi:L-threonylcarbamoyladenylate synthase